MIVNVILWFIFGISHFFMDFKIHINMPYLIRFSLGIMLFLAGRFIIYKAHKIHKEVAVQPEKITSVVREGIFSKIRHPIYLGFILMNWGVFAVVFSWPFLTLSVMFTVIWYLEARAEEKVLCKRFPREYGKYQKKIPMILPNLRFLVCS